MAATQEKPARTRLIGGLALVGVESRRVRPARLQASALVR